jgi:cell division protein FtsB
MPIPKKQRIQILRETIEAQITTLDEYRKENKALARENEKLKKEAEILKKKRHERKTKQPVLQAEE